MPPRPLMPLLAAAWLAVVVRAEETAAPGSRHGVCELSTAPSTVSRLYELEAALAESQVESGDAELGVKGVNELLQDYAAALCTDATGASDRGPGGLAHCPLIDTQGLWGAPDSSELYSGSRTFRGRFQLPQERTVTLDSMRANDYMGSDVAINPAGTVALFGARGRDDGGLDAGAAMIFERSYCSEPAEVGGWPYACWTEAYRAAPFAAGTLANAGESLGLSRAGDVAIVGARGAEVGGFKSAGMVFVYEDKNGAEFGGWTEAAQLEAPDPAAEEFFGGAVALSADGALALIGAYGTDIDVFDMLAFDCDLDYATQGTAECQPGCDHEAQHVLTPLCDPSADVCPPGCAGTGATRHTPVCALNESLPRGGCAAGCAYVAARVDTPVCELAAGAPCPAGCVYANATAAANASCTGVAENVTVNASCTGTATEVTVLGSCSGTATGVNVPESCTGTATPQPVPAGTVVDAGRAYVATPGADGEWGLEVLQAPVPEEAATFGRSVAVIGNTLLVGAPGEGGRPGLAGAGKVFVFRQADGSGSWTVRQVLQPSNPQPGQSFGSYIAVSGEAKGVAAISADQFSGRTALEAGAVYLFRMRPAYNSSVFTVTKEAGCDWDGVDAQGQWQHPGPVAGGGGNHEVECRKACALSWEIGVQCNFMSYSERTGPDNDVRGGICRLFETCDGDSIGPFTTKSRHTTTVEEEWVEFCPLAPDYSVSFDRYGTQVAVSDDASTIAVGATFAEESGGVPNTGIVVLFNTNQVGDYVQRKRLLPEDGGSDSARFGTSVTLNGDGTLLAVGAQLRNNPVATAQDCLDMGGLDACDNTGAVYMYTAQCPFLNMLNSNRDGSSPSGGGRRTCFATIGMDCTFSCNPGWKGGNGSSYPYLTPNGSLNEYALRSTPPATSPAFAATNTSGDARGLYQPRMSSGLGEYLQEWDSVRRAYVYVNSEGMTLAWRTGPDGRGQWAIYNEADELVAWSGDEEYTLREGPPVGPLERGWFVMGWLADGSASYVRDYAFGLTSLTLVQEDSAPKYHIGCRVSTEGSFHADWEIGTDQLCYSVPCPENAHYTDETATACECDLGYAPPVSNGRIDPPRWVAAREEWTGRCVPQPCTPGFIANSDRALERNLNPCTGVTFDTCTFTCDPSYHCAAPRARPAWLTEGDEETDEDGSWALDHTLPDLTRKPDPRERPVVCSATGVDTVIYCDRDGAFQRATCEPTPCPEFSQSTRHYCYDEDGVPLLLEAFEDEDGNQMPFDQRSAAMAAAEAECAEEEGVWVGQWGGEAGCECIANYMVDSWEDPVGRVRWDQPAQAWAGLCEGEWVVASRARGRLFDAVAVLSMLVLPLCFCVVCCVRRHKRKKVERAERYKREAQELRKQEEIDRLADMHKEAVLAAERTKQEQLELAKLSPEEAEAWWHEHNEKERQAKANRKRARGNWVNATSKAVWRYQKRGGGKDHKKPDKILYKWQGKPGTHRGQGSLASAKIMYGKAWDKMGVDEKKLILYRLDTEYSRPTSTEAWQKPMKAGAIHEALEAPEQLERESARTTPASRATASRAAASRGTASRGTGASRGGRQQAGLPGSALLTDKPAVVRALCSLLNRRCSLAEARLPSAAASSFLPILGASQKSLEVASTAPARLW